jgi:hypothetical protein
VVGSLSLSTGTRKFFSLLNQMEIFAGIIGMAIGAVAYNDNFGSGLEFVPLGEI